MNMINMQVLFLYLTLDHKTSHKGKMIFFNSEGGEKEWNRTQPHNPHIRLLLNTQCS